MTTDPERDIVDALYDRFFQRRDVYAIHNGQHYRPVDRKITGKLLLGHLKGEHALGTYLLDADNNCRFFTFDLDLKKTGMSYRVDVDQIIDHMTYRPGEEYPDGLWPDEPEACNLREVWIDPQHPLRPWLAFQLRCLAEGVARKTAAMYPQWPVAVAYSGGKGVHIHVFCGERPAARARALAENVLRSWQNLGVEGERIARFERGPMGWSDRTALYDNINIEIYPKQDVLDAGGYGNLVRLPLGRHPSTRQRSFFVDLQSIPALYPLVEHDAAMALIRGCVL